MFHILIVDGFEDLLWALSKNLFKDRSDVTIHTASNAEQAMEVMRVRALDLLLVDLNHENDVDGFGVILKAKEFAPRAKILIMATNKKGDPEDFSAPLGISHYIQKPFEIDALRSQCAMLIDDEEELYKGLADLALADLLSFVCLGQRTMLLHLHHRGRRGRVEIFMGTIEHAQFEGKQGPEALWMMLALKDGDIFIQGDFEKHPQSIDEHWHTSILDAAAWIEEHGAPEYEEPEVDIPVEGWDDDDLLNTQDSSDAAENLLGFTPEELEEISSLGSPSDEPHFLDILPHGQSAGPPPIPTRVPTSQHPIPMSRPSVEVSSLRGPAAINASDGAAAYSIDAALSSLKEEIPSFISAELIAINEGELLGAAVGEEHPRDHISAGAFYGEVLRTGIRAALSCSDDATLQTLQIITDQHYILARVVPGTGYAQLVTMGRDGNLGIAQVVMRRTDQMLAEVLL